MAQLIFALDDPRAILAVIDSGVRFFKVDEWLLLDRRLNWELVQREVRESDSHIFLDLKLYQPNATVWRIARRAFETAREIMLELSS